MAEIELTEEDYRNIALKIKIDNLSRIATLIPTKYSLVKVISTLGTIKKKPDVVEYERNNIGRYLRFDEEKNDIVKMFLEKMGEYENLVNLNTLHKNLKSVRISEKELDFIGRIKEKLGLSLAAGLYIPINNKIKLFHGDFVSVISETLTHELLHLSSSTKQGIMIYSGFNQFNLVTKVNKGCGIDEGATEFINQTVFGYSYDITSYHELVFIVRGIADLIGRDKIFQLYFDNDLKGLLNEISKYSDKKTAASIITAMDRLYDLNYNRLTRNPASMAKELEENLLSLVINLNLKKQQELLKKNEITQEEYDKNVNEIYMYSVGFFVEKEINPANNRTLYKIGNRYVSIKLTEKDYKKIVEEFKDKLPKLSSKNKRGRYIFNYMQQIRINRNNILRNSDSIYGSVVGVYDVQGNSLDNIRFNYKNFLSHFLESLDAGSEVFEIYDNDGVLHQIDYDSAVRMKKLLWDSCVEYYINNCADELENYKNELEDMIDDYNNSEEEELCFGDNKEI